MEQIELKGAIVGNKHFVDESGQKYEIENVIGGDASGGEHIYTSWNFPEGHPATAFVNESGKVTID